MRACTPKSSSVVFYFRFSFRLHFKKNFFLFRREITEKREKEVKAFLNDTQKEAFQKIIEEQHHKMQERMRGRRRQY